MKKVAGHTAPNHFVKNISSQFSQWVGSPRDAGQGDDV